MAYPFNETTDSEAAAIARVPGMTEEQKDLAFKTAMQVVGAMCEGLGPASPEEMKKSAEGIIDAAKAAAKRLEEPNTD